MIKGISKIKGLGVYDNYTRPIGTQEFGIKNLIYGWNYSGKTTLSRLFAQLEAKKLNHDLIGCEFSFETDGQPITEKNIEQSDLIVRVFNSDFIRENLHFEGSNFKPILLLGKESEDAQSKINDNTDRVKKSEITRRKLETKANDITQAVSTAKTEAAKNLRQLLKIDPYTATQLGNDIPIVGVLGFEILSEKVLSENIELALTPDNKKPSVVDRIETTPSIENIHKEAVTILAAVPTFANTIKHLEEHPEVERWIESGLHIHPHEGTCEFCGNNISENRLIEFRAHFSKDLAEHKQKVENLLQRVKTAEIKLSPPKEAEFNPQFRDTYKVAAEPLPKAIKDFNLAVKALADDVQRKIDAPRKLMEPTSLAEGLASAVTDVVDAINTVIEENNQLAENFSTAKAEATKQVRYHYVQQFVDSQEKAGYERKKTCLVQRRERLRTFAESLKKEIEELQDLISQAQLGREKINERLASMLGGEAIQIVVAKDPTTNQEQFKLVRKSGKVAKNLSDGERTAIAFSYFLTKLQELKPEDFKQTVVYIDDPISSLDANHIFQITAAIRAIFFKKENENSAWETTCKQLFVSTHNFEFFNLLREIKPESSRQGGRLFLIKRLSEVHSTLSDMPISLANYQSEYHFLFEVIYRFHQAPDKTDHTTLMLLPNAMRRFIELYTYSRLPGIMKETVDQRAEALFGLEKSKRILKVFHYFSHANTIDRLAGNNELIFDIEHAVKDLIEAITQTDQKHMDALIASL
ncbi:AAA family ATPase [Pseudomonas proteolytica]|uniref:AAA family ATPase n=1 Tax=Pseudomonas proteolytica TaxID=219574 RepID=UPI0030EEE4E8